MTTAANQWYSQRKYYWCPQNAKYFFVHYQNVNFSIIAITIIFKATTIEREMEERSAQK